MKKLIIYILASFILASVMAYPTGIVVRYPNNAVKTECIYMETDFSAYDALQQSSFDARWQGSGQMAFLTSLDGISGSGLDGWSFWIEDGSSFTDSQVGFGAQKLDEDEVFGVSYATFEPPEYKPVPPPPYMPFEQVCGLRVTRLKAYVDNDRVNSDDIDEDGGVISKAKPLSIIRIEFNLRNIWSEGIDDIKVKGTILELDNGLEDEIDEFDLEDDEKEDITLEFEIPDDAEEQTYDLLIEITGEDRLGNAYRSILNNLELDIDKDTYSIIIDSVDVPGTAKCGGNLPVSVGITNLGSRDQDITLSVINDDLNIKSEVTEKVESDEESNDLDIPADVSIGFLAENKAYNFTIIVEHQGGNEEFSRQVIISGCAGQPRQSRDESGQKVETDTSKEGQEPLGNEDTKSSTFVPAAATGQSVEKEENEGMPTSFLIIAVVVAALLVIALAIILSVSSRGSP